MPPTTAQANAIAERRIGTIRRECADWILLRHVLA
jgi:hypothetical protein